MIFFSFGCNTVVGNLYQYNEDDFRFQFLFISSFITAWVHKKIIETQRSCQIKNLPFLLNL